MTVSREAEKRGRGKEVAADRQVHDGQLSVEGETVRFRGSR